MYVCVRVCVRVDRCLCVCVLVSVAVGVRVGVLLYAAVCVHVYGSGFVKPCPLLRPFDQ